MMKNYISFLLFLSFLCFQAQEIVDKEEFKKCKKEFSKKICLSDEDKDSVLFYLDECPKVFGVVENNGCPWADNDNDGVFDKDDACFDVSGPEENRGCPWPDTDGDGILDKDDACPTVFGIKEENGCPNKNDCSEFFKREEKLFDEFKIREQNNDEKISNLRKIIFDKLSKKLFKNNSISVFIYTNTFINDNISNCQSKSTLFHDKSLFLDQLFWNKQAFEQLSKKLDKNIIPQINNRRTNINKKLLKKFTEQGYYNFIENFSLKESENLNESFYYYHYGKNNENNIFGFIDSIEVDLGNYERNEVNVIITTLTQNKSDLKYKFKYISNQWKLVE